VNQVQLKCLGELTGMQSVQAVDTTIAMPIVGLTTDSGTNNTDKLTNNAALTISTAAADVMRLLTVTMSSIAINGTLTGVLLPGVMAQLVLPAQYLVVIAWSVR